MKECRPKASDLYVITLIFWRFAHIYRHELGRCHTLLPFLTYFLSFHFSRFSFYIYIICAKFHYYVKYTKKLNFFPLPFTTAIKSHVQKLNQQMNLTFM